MTPLRCINCGGRRIEVGEGGAPSHCARCGGRMLPQAISPAGIVTPAAPVPPERGKALFDKMRAAIEPRDL